MTAYINLDTGEYPRHPGDMALEPNCNYASVNWVDAPDYNENTQVAYEGPPECVNGEWYMVWIVRDLTPEEITAREEAIAAKNPPSLDVNVPGTAPDVIG